MISAKWPLFQPYFSLHFDKYSGLFQQFRHGCFVLASQLLLAFWCRPNPSNTLAPSRWNPEHEN